MYEESVKSAKNRTGFVARVNWSKVARLALVSRQTVYNWRERRHETYTDIERRIRAVIANEYGNHTLINILNHRKTRS